MARRNRTTLAVTVRRGGKRHTYRAAAALCTFSVGVLAAHGADIFGGLLTRPKRQALRVVKMGPITKFSLVFKQRYWDDVMTVLSHPTGLARTFFAAFPGGTGGPHVLTGLLMGHDHRVISGMGDTPAARFLVEQLGTILSRGAGWQAQDVLVSRSARSFRPKLLRTDWSQDPFTCGANSYISHVPGAPIAISDLRETLKTPLASLPMFWAGEATAPAYNRYYQPLSVHGAYMSGLRVADDIANYLDLGNANDFGDYYRTRYRIDRSEQAGTAPAVAALSAAQKRRAGLTDSARRRSAVDRQMERFDVHTG